MNYRYSANAQFVIDANTRLTVTVGTPLPGNRKSYCQDLWMKIF